MKPAKGLCLALALFAPAVLYAGQIYGTIVSDGRLSVLAVNRGVPFVVSHPDSVLSRDVTKLARTLAGDGAGAAQDQPNKRGLFARR